MLMMSGMKFDEDGNLIKKMIYDAGKVTKKYNVEYEYKPKIIKFNESRPNEKLSDEDVNRFQSMLMNNL